MRDLFQSTVIGFMANNLFPARFGEIIRAVVLGRKTGVGKTASFATIVLERMFDGMTILFFLAVTVGLLNLPFPIWLRKASIAAVVGCLLLLSLLIALKEWKALFITAMLSLFLWIFPALSIFYALHAAGIHLPLSASFFLLGVLCIGVAVPSAPGFVGTIQFVSVIGLACFGVGKSQVLSYSILYHLSQYIPVTALGLVFFFSEGLSFSKIRTAADVRDVSEDAHSQKTVEM
jgi:uncharacterized membrane protein YbhN (UPF0104 family)